MTIQNEVLLVDNEWTARSAARDIGTRLDHPVRPLSGYPQMVEALHEIADDASSIEPIVILDAGIDGICRLETVYRAVNQFPRARVVLWTANREPCGHGGALMDGAYAALPKERPLKVLTRVIERVATGRRWCEPDQAQWFVELLEGMDRHVNEQRDHVWQSTELNRIQDRGFNADLDRLKEIARGEPLGPDDTWFAHMLLDLRPFWLPPFLRRALMALCVNETGAEAAHSLGNTTATVGGYRTRISGRLMPHRLTRSGPADPKDFAFIRMLSQLHSVCELAPEDHDLRAESWGLRPRNGPPPSATS